jgi:hypothetical protein
LPLFQGVRWITVGAGFSQCCMVILPQLLRVTTVHLATTLKRLKLRQLLGLGREMGCGSDDFGPKMTHTGSRESLMIGCIIRVIPAD